MRELAVLLAIGCAVVAYLRADVALIVAALVLGYSAGVALLRKQSP
jgi:hypothetical protein